MKLSRWGSIDPNLNLEKKLRSIAIHFLGRLLHIYRLRERPIFIFATRRGGSTLLAQMIASQPGVDFSGEPLNLWRYTPYYGRLPHPPQSRFIHLSGEDERKVREYFQDLLSGRIRVFNEWNPFSPLYSFRVHRLVIQLLGANTLIDWFTQNFDIEVVYLLRHPVPVALSCLKNKWGLDAPAYVENEYFREEFLGLERTRFAERILREGTPVQQYVLEWCLENLYPLRVFRERPWLTVTYEELVMRPRQMAGLLCERVGLPDPERMMHMVYRPSRTTYLKDSRKAIATQGPGAMVTRWTKRLKPEEFEQVREVLDMFGIRAYRAESPFPDPEMCHFGPLQGIAGEEK